MQGLESISDLIVLAQPSAWRNLGQRFSGDHLQWQREDLIGGLLLLGVLVAGFWVLHWLAGWQAEQDKRHSPKRLAKELAAAHRLSYRERQICHEVVAAMGLSDPAELFVRIEASERIAKRDAGLAARLFGAA